MNNNNTLIIFIMAALFWLSCNKEKEPMYDLKMNDSIVVSLKNNSVDNKLDSIGFLEFIGNQKLQDVYDIATWQYRNKSQDTVLNAQIKNYFKYDDTLSIHRLYAEIDSSQAYYVKISQLSLVPKDSLKNDSIGKMNFQVYYFNKDKKFFQKTEKQVSYVLQKQPEKLKNQFSFYFYDLAEKDSTASGVTQ